VTDRSARLGRPEQGSPLSNSLATTAFGRSPEVPVQLSVDGHHYLTGLELDPVEHARRSRSQLGACTSTGLLHALWELPFGVAISWESLSFMDRCTLDEGGEGWVERKDDSVVRTYQPAGLIRSVFVSHGSLSKAVKGAASHPPTVRRVALWMEAAHRWSHNHEASLAKARALGVGVWASSGERVSRLLEPAQPLLGRPVVFRWWQAELAYRNWLSSTGPTGTAVPLG
jgi:hypothetical protein